MPLKRYEKIIKAPETNLNLPTGSPIWKIKTDPEAGLLALELRDINRLQVQFAVADAAAGTWLHPPFALKENWRISLAGIRNGKLLLHGFSGGAINRPKGLILLNPENEQVVWELPELAFYGWTKQGLLVSDPEHPETGLAEVALETGTLIRQKINREVGQQEGMSWEKNRLEPVYKVPGHYTPDSEYYPVLAGFIELKALHKTIYAIDYLEYNEYIVVSYYTANKDSDKLTHWLIVCNKNTGALLFQDCLNTESIGIAPENFFIFQSNLFYVQQAACLLGLKLI